jgi:DNA-binding NtrC family response regulator
MTDDNPQLQKTVLVVACSDSPVMSVVSTVLSSWKLECTQITTRRSPWWRRPLSTLLSPTKPAPAEETSNCFEKLRLARPHARVMIVADKSTPADVIAAMRAQAFSYFTKPFPRALWKRCCN